MATKKTLLLIYLLTLLPRLYQLSATAVYPDEITWIARGKELIYALAGFRFSYISQAWWNDRKEGQAIGLPVSFLSGLAQIALAGSSRYSLHLFPDIIAARLPAIFLHSLLPPAIFLFLIRLGKPKIGLITALSYSLSPIAFGLDRWVVHDSSLTLFTFLAASTYIIDLSRAKLSFWPGVFLGLAFLAKPNGVLVAIAWLILSFSYHNYRLLITNILSCLLTIIIIWPQSWILPVFSIFNYSLQQLFFAQKPQVYFYLGHIGTTVPWHYYFFQFLSRSPEVVLIALSISAALFASRVYHKKTDYRITLSVISYLVVFLAILIFSLLKNGIRYALPILPWIYIASAWGLAQLPKRRFIYPVYLTILLFPFQYFPNSYSLYYNFFTGGPMVAKKYDLVGLCLGNKAALNYLDANRISGSVTVLGCPDTAPYHTHTNRHITKDWSNVDYIILESAHQQLFPTDPAVISLSTRKPIQTVSENGVVTAYIYK